MTETPTSVASLSRAGAIRIIDALRDGSNCLEGAGAYSVGRDVLIRAATDCFEEIELSGGAVVRWIRGRPEQGKTNMFARINEIALDRNWVTSYVQIAEPGGGVELHRFQTVYASIVRNCLCRDLIVEESGRVDPGRIAGWDWILRQWYAGMRSQAGGRGVDVPSMVLRDVIEQTMTAMRRKWSLHGSFGEALRQFALAQADGDESWTQILSSWFLGEDVHARGGEIKKRLREAGITESLSKQNSKDILRSMSLFLRYRGFGGLLVLIDEVENVLHSPAKARASSYITLRELIDNATPRHGMVRTIMYVSATPDFFDHQKGLTQVEPAASRVILAPLVLTDPPSAGRAEANPAGTVIDLSQFPISKADFLEIARRIAAIHGLAKAWTPDEGTVDGIVGLLDKLLANPDLTIRAWVRRIVDELDRACAVRRPN